LVKQRIQTFGFGHGNLDLTTLQ